MMAACGGGGGATVVALLVAAPSAHSHSAGTPLGVHAVL
jgi:hypothetical protein